MQSVWQADAALPKFPKLKKDLHTDVLIIGGGMAGLLTAYFLHQSGVQYMLVEKGRICSGITQHTTAKLTAQHGLIYHKLFKSGGLEAAQQSFSTAKRLPQALEEVTKITLLQLPPILELASILTGIGFMTKRTALFNVIPIPLLPVVDIMFRIMVVLFDMNTDFFYYGFQSMLVNLAYNPTTDYILKSYLICAVVIVAINLLGYLSFKKTEIK